MSALWQKFREFIRSKFMFFVGAGVAGVGMLGFAMLYATALDYTSQLSFCAHSCHEMEATVYQEYLESNHFKNQHGVVVVCADCHVPHHNWPAVFVTKFFATFELWNHFVDQEYKLENFNPRRLKLAKEVLAHFAATNARECKACHQYSNMVLEQQRSSVSAHHTDAMKKDQNCLECHEGVVHKKMVDPAKAVSADGVDLP